MEDAPPRAVRERTFERIVEASTRTPTLPGTRMLLQVHSGEWGVLRIELTVKGSDVHASLTTGSEAAREAIVSHLDELRTRLEGQGLQLGEFLANLETPSVPSDVENEPALRSVRSQILDVVA